MTLEKDTENSNATLSIVEASADEKLEADEYTQFSRRRKWVITAMLAAGAFLPPMSATMINSALPQVANQYDTTGSIINLSNALYLVAAGISPCFAGPLSTLYGRRTVLLSAAALYGAFSLGSGLSPNLGSYFAFRMLTAFASTPLLSVGNACLSDIWQPVERATAGGWVLLGFELGPTIGPFIGGVMVTYRSWRTLFYLQAALGAFIFILYVVALPETAFPKHRHSNKGSESHALKLAKAVNPLRVVGLFRYKTVLAAGFGSGALSWNMYSLLVPISYLLNERFNLRTPLKAGLFFLAPGAGYIVGALVGGRWADYVAIRSMRKTGRRRPEDRLKACLPFIGILAPISMLLYGWSVQYRFGGVPLPVIMMFLQALAQLFGFLTINPYCLDVMQSTGRSADVIAGNYFARYMFGAVGTAVALPIINSIGVGWLSTISAVLLIASTAALALTAR